MMTRDFVASSVCVVCVCLCVRSSGLEEEVEEIDSFQFGASVCLIDQAIDFTLILLEKELESSIKRWRLWRINGDKFWSTFQQWAIRT